MPSPPLGPGPSRARPCAAQQPRHAALPPRAAAKAVPAGQDKTLVLDGAVAERLGIGTWRYRPAKERLALTGCLASHLLGVEAVDLHLDDLLDRLSEGGGEALAGYLHGGTPIDGQLCRVRGRDGAHAWFRLVGADATSGFVQRLSDSPVPREEDGTDRQRLQRALERQLADARPPAAIVLLLVKIDQLALLEQNRLRGGPSLVDTVMLRLRGLPEMRAGYWIENDVLALVLGNGRRLRASDCVRRAHAALGAPIAIDGRDCVLTTTIGAATWPRHAATAELLHQRAEIALAYAQKQHRRDRHAVFTRRIAAELADRLALENDLRNALARNEIELRYQPIVDLGQRRIGALEALLRWRHPERGFVPPAIFIPLAEQLGLIQPLTEWLIRTAGGELQALLERFPHLRLNINLSARQARPELIRALLRQFVEGAPLAPQRVTFEVTEGALLENAAPALEALGELKAKGCRIALDDFGTGFSSISYLEQFPIDIIKIDKGFVHRLRGSVESRKLVEAMLFMAAALELHCVAEGVENFEELALLAAKGCHQIQGFLFAAPLTAAALAACLDGFVFPEEALGEALWPKAKGLPRLLSDNQEEALKLFVKHVPLAVAMFDPDMRYLAASDRWIKDYGIKSEAIVGRCHYEVLPATPQKWREGHARVLASGRVESAAVDSYRHACGRIDWLRWEVRPFHNRFGDVAGIIIFSEFITDRIEAEARRRDSEEKLADYLATASDWFWETDAEHRIVYDSTGGAPAAGTPVGRTHWALAGVAEPRQDPAWAMHLAVRDARRPFRDFRYALVTPAAAAEDAEDRIAYVAISGKPVFDAKGVFKGYRGTGRTITASVEAEQAMVRQSEQLVFAGRLAGIGYWRTDLRRQTVDWSPEIYRMIGREPAAFRPDLANRFDIFHPEDRGRAMAAIEQAAKNGSVHYEARVCRPDGGIRFIVCHGRPEFDRNGRLGGFFGIFQDITEHRLTALAAEHQAGQLALASTLAGLGYWSHDRTTGTTFWSDEIQRIIGRPPATAAAGEFVPGCAMLPREGPCCPVADEAARAAHAASWRQAVDAGGDFEDRLQLCHPDGTRRHVLIKARARHDGDGLLTGYFGIVQDITGQVEAAAATAARSRENELYRAMFDILPDFIFAKDRAGRFLAANAATAAIMQAGTPEALIGKTDHDFYEAAIADRFRQDEEAFMAHGQTVIMEQPVRRLDGSIGHLCSLKAPIRDRAGNLLGYVGHGRDVTEEKRARSALIASEAHFRQLVDGSLQALMIEQAAAVVFANERFARLLGYPDSQAAMADAVEHRSRQPAPTRQLLARLSRRLAAGEAFEEPARLELVRPDGEHLTVDSLACSITWQGRPALQYTMIDVTRQVRYEAALEAEKARLAAQADEMTRLAAALARSKLEAETARDMLNDATAVLSDGFALFDPDGRIVSCNPALASIYGRTPEELVGLSIRQCVGLSLALGPHPPDSEAARSWLDARLRAHQRADGTPFEMPIGERWFVLRENRTPKGMTTLLRSEITHLKAIQGELERLATIDVLTELANRRHFTVQATRLLARCAADGSPAALLMVDIDRFKRINDRFGHAAGDHALCQVAESCRRVLRPADLVARWGGEEFIIFLPALALPAAEKVAQRLRRSMAGLLIHTATADFGFTVSIGLAIHAADEPLEGLINRADRALYVAKLEGRDRVVVDAPPAASRAGAGKRGGRPLACPPRER